MKKFYVKLYTHTPIFYKNRGFPRDKKSVPYIPGKALIQPIQNAIIFYFSREDDFVERRIRRYIFGGFRRQKAVPDILNIVIDRHDLILGLWVPDRIYLTDDMIKKTEIVVYDVEADVDVDMFEAEVFEGAVELPFFVRDYPKLAEVMRSYGEFLINAESGMLKKVNTVKNFYDMFADKLKDEDMFPIRVGQWVYNSPYSGSFLNFWNDRDVQMHLFNRFGMEIVPKKYLFTSENRLPLGWAEFNVVESQQDDDDEVEA